MADISASSDSYSFGKVLKECCTRMICLFCNESILLRKFIIRLRYSSHLIVGIFFTSFAA